MQHFGLSPTQVPILMATFGKALGTFGAMVAGSDTLIEYLIQFARSYIYTTALPVAIAAATRASLKLVVEEPWRRSHLRDLIAHFRQRAQALYLPLMESDTAIQPLLVGESDLALELSDSLRQRGVLVGAIRPPTVPAGSARLRITLCAAHSREQIDYLLDTLAECCSSSERAR